MVFDCSRNKVLKLHERPLMILDGSFYTRISRIHEIFHSNCLFVSFGKTSWFRPHEVVSNGIWPVTSQCEQLQTSGWVLAVCGVTLHDAKVSAILEQRAPLEVRSCHAFDQTEAVETNSPWKKEESNWLLSVWGDTCCITTSAAVCRSDMKSHTTHYTGRCLCSNVDATAPCGMGQ